MRKKRFIMPPGVGGFIWPSAERTIEIRKGTLRILEAKLARETSEREKRQLRPLDNLFR